MPNSAAIFPSCWLDEAEERLEGHDLSVRTGRTRYRYAFAEKSLAKPMYPLPTQGTVLKPVVTNSIAFAGQPFQRSCLVLGCLTKFFFSSLFFLPFPTPTNAVLCQNRGRLAEKRTIPLPPTRIPKKELTSIFSHSDDSEESDKSNGQPPEVKQEEDLHISIMKRRYFPARACCVVGAKTEKTGQRVTSLWGPVRPRHLQGLKLKCRCHIAQKEYLGPLFYFLTPVWGEQGSVGPWTTGHVFALKACDLQPVNGRSPSVQHSVSLCLGRPRNGMTKGSSVSVLARL